MIIDDRQKITPEELKRRMEQETKFLLLDVLPEYYFNQKHLPGAENACVYEVVFSDNVKNIQADHDIPVVVYGQNDHYLAAAAAYTRLKRSGYSEVYELKGGIEAWEAAGFPLYASNEFTLGDYLEPDLHKQKKHLTADAGISRIGWRGRNLANRHHGDIRISSGEIGVDAGTLLSSRFVLDMNSICCHDLKDDKRNGVLIKHLKSADFFETETYPEAVFESTEIRPVNPGKPGKPNYLVRGNLTVKNITHEIEFDASAGWDPTGTLYVQGIFEIDRTRWNVMYGSGRFFEKLGKHLVNDLITIELFIKAA